MKELLQIQQRLKAPKNNYNTFGKYNYRSCEDILAAVKPLLQELECTLTLSDDMVAAGERYYIKATATLTNAAGEQVVTTAFAREEEIKKGMDASQITGTASSYARKYALNGLFGIDDVKDADALNTNKEYTEHPQSWQMQVKQAKSYAELKRIQDAHPELKDNSEFTQALNDRYTQIR